ncbi:MAG TPA: diguanylate cyclase [Candidatus Acidoferrales bacterium]
MMLTAEPITPLLLLLSAGFVAAFYGFLYDQKRQPYLLVWTAAWVVLTIHYISPAVKGIIWGTTRQTPIEGAVNQWLLAVAALGFVIAARLYTQSKPWIWPLGGAAVAFGAWSAAFAFQWVTVPPYLGIAFVMFGAALVFWQEGRRQESVADRLLGLTFVLWGVMLLATVFRDQWAAMVTDQIRLLVMLPQVFSAGLMVMALYEEEKRRVERNMLALSNLNLATSSFVGGEIQRMLSQALDRVLSVVRIPAGALFLHHGDPTGPTSVVAVGLSEQFCATAQEEGLDDHIVHLVARLGGILVFRDLGNSGLWEELEKKEAPFSRFRSMAVLEGLRTVVGISLQAKERVFGVLLLGTPDNRRFTPAELRLLLALGHQIGMAVENSYLIQQTARRTEELHVLNEIGRALSSTLDASTLFDKIYQEMRRLFDTGNFYIAFYDSRRNEIRFELEVVGGQRLPKRTRPAGNHLSEYLVRTRQPVLIRENFVEECRKLGVQPLQKTGCFCGVPLVLYDRAIGVMAVFSSQERMFDEGHLELMRVLGSEAAIALENARLFGEEQKKSLHLTLLNNISGHGITTLNPDEMLAKIADEMGHVLTYDHIGIGLLDYVKREVVIQAEAGKRREALGLRIPLGEGLVGQVARTGHMATVREITEDSPQPVLLGSVSAMALPIVYADQLLGVFYVETAQPNDFYEEEVLLLRTLADLVAGAVHNALVFQKAQEQAITDGLTGVKTHRFFMEALSSEWKRATRAGRAFSLVLMDLDRFKFVNDFYGHLEGDAVLQRIGHILEQNCRRSDVVSRYGGDEFVILMPETTVEQARQLAGKLRSWVAADPMLREKNITASFGIATFPAHGSTPQELIQVADASMYLSKHQGGNAVSTADNYNPDETRKWKRDVLEAYLAVILKRLFSTGPDAFEEIHRRLEQFSASLHAEPALTGGDDHPTAPEVAVLPPLVIETLTSLAAAIDAKDHYTQGHSQKVSSYALTLARTLAEAPPEEGSGEPRLSEQQIENIRLAGLLHDVGKVGIPEFILNKAAPLTAEEWETMKTHVTLGARLLDPLASRSVASVGDLRLAVRHHHEFFDGSGYPDGLAGEAIPLSARIVTIADAYDTITSERTYKKARPAEQAFAELRRCAGAQFDPQLVELFVEAVQRQPRPLAEPSGRVVVTNPAEPPI